MTFQTDVLLNNYQLLIDGAIVTLQITAMALVLGIVLGAAVCAARLARSPFYNRLARGYVGFFRTTPEMILIFWAYFCVPLIFQIRVSGLLVGSIVLGLASAAYLAEIFRAGIEAVPKGQFEASHSLNLRGWRLWFFVVLPQALKLMVAPLVNYFTELLKNSTLLAGIGVADLSLQAYLLGGQTYRYIEFLTAIAFIYFAVIFPISLLSRRLERRAGSH